MIDTAYWMRTEESATTALINENRTVSIDHLKASRCCNLMWSVIIPYPILSLLLSTIYRIYRLSVFLLYIIRVYRIRARLCTVYRNRRHDPSRHTEWERRHNRKKQQHSITGTVTSMATNTAAGQSALLGVRSARCSDKIVPTLLIYATLIFCSITILAKSEKFISLRLFAT